MAIFGNDLQLRKINEIPQIQQDLKLEEFNLRGKSVADSFTSKLTDMAEKAKQRQSEQGVGLKLDVLGYGLGFSPSDPAASMLSEAKESIDNQDYQKALQILIEVLDKHPEHHEAYYLAAYCHAKLESFMQGLRLLRPLAHMRLENSLASRVESLRIDIRDSLFVELVLGSFVALQFHQYDSFITHVNEVIQLDPAWTMCYFILAGMLMNAERLSDARATVEAGLRSCPVDERSLLVEVNQEILHRQILKEMETARHWFKKGNYRRARTELNRLSSVARDLPLWVTFENYLSQLDSGSLLGSLLGRNRSPCEVTPRGSFQEVDALYFFLVGSEIRQAKECLNANRFEDAESNLRNALKDTPHFCFANYQYAGCIYSRLTYRLSGERPPELAEIISELNRARGFAEIGARDPEIEDASKLLDAISALIGQITEVERQVRERQQESEMVNQTIQEFQAIMNIAEGGIRSYSHYEQVSSRLKAFRENLNGVRRKTRSDDARKVIQQVSEAAEQNWKQLQTMEASIRESGIVEKHFTAYTTKMNQIQSKGGIHSRSDLDSAHSFFKSLMYQVITDRTKVKNLDAQQSLDKLLDALRNILKQFGD